MNQKVYYKICSRIGHNWAIKDEDTFMKRICLNCGYEEYFFPEEVIEE